MQVLRLNGNFQNKMLAPTNAKMFKVWLCHGVLKKLEWMATDLEIDLL